jgi:hypothetical protein
MSFSHSYYRLEPLVPSNINRSNPVSHAVLPALILDIRKIYKAYFASFNKEHMGNIMLGILFPNGVDSEQFRAAHTAGTLDWWHKSDTQYAYKCVDIHGRDCGNGPH